MGERKSKGMGMGMGMEMGMGMGGNRGKKKKTTKSLHPIIISTQYPKKYRGGKVIP